MAILQDAEDANFIQQVLYGTVRYRGLIQSLLKAFYFKNAGNASRQDAHLYSVVAYLGLFRLEELTFPQFRRLVKSQEPHVRNLACLSRTNALKNTFEDISQIMVFHRGRSKSLLVQKISWKHSLPDFSTSLLLLQIMLVFLKFLFNADTLIELCRDSWLKLYDKPFVDDLISIVQSWSPETRQLMDHLEVRLRQRPRVV